MRHQALALWFAAAFFAAGPARAQPSPPDTPDTPEDRAAELAHEGLQRYKEGKWLDALSRLESAQKLVRSPVFDLYMARALRNVGRLLEAKAHYEAIAGSPLPESAPRAWRDAHSEAGRELSAVAERIPSLVVIVKPSDTGVRATLDGRAIETARPTLSDPGMRTVAVTRDGREVVDPLHRLPNAGSMVFFVGHGTTGEYSFKGRVELVPPNVEITRCEAPHKSLVLQTVPVRFERRLALPPLGSKLFPVALSAEQQDAYAEVFEETFPRPQLALFGFDRPEEDELRHDEETLLRIDQSTNLRLDVGVAASVCFYLGREQLAARRFDTARVHESFAV